MSEKEKKQRPVSVPKTKEEIEKEIQMLNEDHEIYKQFIQWKGRE